MTAAAGWTQRETEAGALPAYLACPNDGLPHPAVVVIMEIFGVDDYVQEVVRRYAEAGFVAVAPDLFHRSTIRLFSYEDVSSALEVARGLTAMQVEADVAATIDLLRERTDVAAGPAGLVGYCFGGFLAYRVATAEKRLGGVVVYYGPGIAGDDAAAPVKDSAGINAPMLLLFGGRDPLIPASQVQRIEDALTRLGKAHEVVTYPDAGHAFACFARAENYDQSAAENAWERTLGFFRRHLTPAAS